MIESDRRLLLVHAHPDDETTGTGATMARYAAAGARVTLLTCTLGELGEVVVPELAQLAAGQADQLGGYRIGELSAAMSVLGVSDHRFLGGAGRFRDSGMIDRPGNRSPRAFWRAADDPAVFDAAVLAAVHVIREVRPQVVVTYDPNGGYGHPDHIMAHRVTTAAVEVAADPAVTNGAAPWSVAKLYWTAFPMSVLQAGIEAAKAAGEQGFFGAERAEAMDIGCPDELVTTAIDGRAYAGAKMAAMRAHASQIEVDGPLLRLAERMGNEAWGVEYYRLVRGRATPGPDGREDDLFAGLDT